MERVEAEHPLQRLRDRFPVPANLGAEIVHGQYVDNFFSIPAQLDRAIVEAFHELFKE